MVYASQFYNTNFDRDRSNTNDAMWCQSANATSNIGLWYYPNGTEVPIFDGAFIDPSAPIAHCLVRDTVVRLHWLEELD